MKQASRQSSRKPAYKLVLFDVGIGLAAAVWPLISVGLDAVRCGEGYDCDSAASFWGDRPDAWQFDVFHLTSVVGALTIVACAHLLVTQRRRGALWAGLTVLALFCVWLGIWLAANRVLL